MIQFIDLSITMSVKAAILNIFIDIRYFPDPMRLPSCPHSEFRMVAKAIKLFIGKMVKKYIRVVRLEGTILQCQ
jgi:hypothetical protein